MLAVRQLSIPVAALLALAASAATFLFDVSQPLGVAGGMPYVALPLLGLLARSPALVVAIALAGSVLTGAGLIASAPGASYEVALTNRAMSGLLIWIVTFIALRHLHVGNALQAQLQRQASTDPLTGLFNRRHVFAQIENELNRYRRYGEAFSVILIDADHFKRVNDRFGHGAGDATLCRIADVCRRSVRETDVTGRFGGEEFIVLLPHTDGRAAAVVAERIRKTMHRTDVEAHPDAVAVTLSLGVAEVGPGSDSFDALLKEADTALYAAKDAGRDRVALAAAIGPGARSADAA